MTHSDYSCAEAQKQPETQIVIILKDRWVYKHAHSCVYAPYTYLKMWVCVCVCTIQMLEDVCVPYTCLKMCVCVCVCVLGGRVVVVSASYTCLQICVCVFVGRSDLCFAVLWCKDVDTNRITHIRQSEKDRIERREERKRGGKRQKRKDRTERRKDHKVILFQSVNCWFSCGSWPPAHTHTHCSENYLQGGNQCLSNQEMRKTRGIYCMYLCVCVCVCVCACVCAWVCWYVREEVGLKEHTLVLTRVCVWEWELWWQIAQWVCVNGSYHHWQRVRGKCVTNTANHMVFWAWKIRKIKAFPLLLLLLIKHGIPIWGVLLLA